MMWQNFSHLTTAAFAGILKSQLHFNFYRFLNQYRINQGKNIDAKIAI